MKQLNCSPPEYILPGTKECLLGPLQPQSENLKVSYQGNCSLRIIGKYTVVLQPYMGQHGGRAGSVAYLQLQDPWFELG